MRDYLNLIDTNTPGNRCDVTPLFADADAFTQMVNELATPFTPAEIDLVAGIDALGFILASAIALKLHKGMLPIRKGGKLPVAVKTQQFTDYSGQTKSLELRQGSLKGGERVLLVDEWIETGAQVQAAIDLIEGEGGIIAGIAAINIDQNPQTLRLQQKYKCRSLMINEG